MSMISGMIKNFVDIYSVTKDEYGDTTETLIYSNVKCRFRENIRRSLTADSDKLIYRSKVYILPNYTLEEDYIIKKDGKIFTIALIEEKRDLAGNVDFYEVYLA